MSFCAKRLCVCGHELTVFLETDTQQIFAVSSWMADFLQLQPASVRTRLSQLGMKTLKHMQLKRWCVEHGFLPRGTRKAGFLPQHALRALCWDRFPDQHAEVEVAFRSVFQQPALPLPKSEQPERLARKRTRKLVRVLSDVDADEEENDCEVELYDDDVEELPLVTLTAKLKLPRQEFSPEQFTKSYALREYDISDALKAELRALERFWTRSFVSNRQGNAVGTVTFSKRRERILCFFGFLVLYNCCDRESLSLQMFKEWKAVESFIRYLQEVRQLSSATVAEFLTAAIFVCKWLERDNEQVGNQFSNVQVIRRYKDWRNQFHSRVNAERKDQTWDDLRERGKWLHWEEYVETVNKLQRKFWERAAKKPHDRKTAVLCHDALLLTLFRYLPGRAGEARLLRHMSESDVREAKPTHQSLRSWVREMRINLITQRKDVWTIVCGNYKTLKSHGVDVTEFDAEQHAPLIRLLNAWLETYRGWLCNDSEEDHVFVTREGKPFTSAYFSTFLGKLLKKLTDQHVSANVLRSSFITYFYDSEAAENQQLRESVAKVMRHSVREAQETYDRRNSAQKKRKGMEAIAE